VKKTVQYILIVLLAIKGVGQLISALPRISSPEGATTTIAALLYIVAIVGIFFDKKWAVILALVVLGLELISSFMGNVSMGDIIALVINIVLAGLLYWLLVRRTRRPASYS
jgi:hypothetical protein